MGQLFPFHAFLRYLLQLPPQHCLDRLKDLALGVQVVIVEVQGLLMQLLEDAVDLSRRPLARVADSLSARFEVALMSLSASLKSAPKLAQGLTAVVPDGHDSVIGVEDYGEAVDVAEIAIIGLAGEDFDGLI